MITAVSACPRDKGISYTADTIARLFKDGKAAEVFALDDLSWIGSGKACHELLTLVNKIYPGEDVLLLEDDVRCCQNAVIACESVPFPADCPMLSFFTNRIRYCERRPEGVDFEYIDVRENYLYKYAPIRKGVYLRPASRNFMYAQALKLSAAFVEHIVKAGQPTSEHMGIPSTQSGIIELGQVRDMMLGWHAGNFGQWIGQVAPNWFQHIGLRSAALARALREDAQFTRAKIVSGMWLGEEHDALTDDVSSVYQCP